MERAAAVRLLRVLVARGLCADAPLADAAIQHFALQAGLDKEFNEAWNYAHQQGWLVNMIAGWSKLSAIGYAVGQKGSPRHPARSAVRAIAEKLLKPRRRYGRIARRILNVAMPEISLGRARIVAIVG